MEYHLNFIIHSVWHFFDLSDPKETEGYHQTLFANKKIQTQKSY